MTWLPAKSVTVKTILLIPSDKLTLVENSPVDELKLIVKEHQSNGASGGGLNQAAHPPIDGEQHQQGNDVQQIQQKR